MMYSSILNNIKKHKLRYFEHIKNHNLLEKGILGERWTGAEKEEEQEERSAQNRENSLRESSGSNV